MYIALDYVSKHVHGTDIGLKVCKSDSDISRPGSSHGLHSYAFSLTKNGMKCEMELNIEKKLREMVQIKKFAPSPP